MVKEKNVLERAGETVTTFRSDEIITGTSTNLISNDVDPNCTQAQKIETKNKREAAKTLKDTPLIDSYDMSVNRYKNKNQSTYDMHSERHIDIDWKSPYREKRFYPSIPGPNDNHSDILKLVKEKPDSYIICNINIKACHYAECIPVEPSDYCETINIQGRTFCGMTYSGDEVVVEILNPGSNKDMERMLYGKVVAILARKPCLNYDHPIFYCSIDSFDSYDSYKSMKPLCKSLPKINVLMKKGKPKDTFHLFTVVKNNRILFQDTIKINPNQIEKYVFKVAILYWTQRYPKGCILEVKKYENPMNDYELIKMRYNIPLLFSKQAVDYTESQIKKDQLDIIEETDREDRTEKLCFTIDPEGSVDLDDALSAENINSGNTVLVGVHIADVSASVRVGDPLDIDARERVSSHYPNKETIHMLPKPFLERFCSLLPNETRKAISVYFYFDKDGHLYDTKVEASLIKSKKQFTYRDVQDIIEGKQTSEYHQTILKLNDISTSLRTKRLGTGAHFLQIDNSTFQTLDAHRLVEEFMILANHKVSEILTDNFPNLAIIRCQECPNEHHIKKWSKKFKRILSCLVNIKGKSLFKDKIRFTDSSLLDYVTVQKAVFDEILKLAEDNSLRDSCKYMCMDQCHPEQAIAYSEWISINKRSSYKCSGDMKEHERKHFSLGIYPYTHFTSPIRRYPDLIVQRFLHSYLNNKKVDYTGKDIKDICKESNQVMRDAKMCKNMSATIHLGKCLRNKPLPVFGIVKTISKDSLVLYIPWLAFLPDKYLTIEFSLLQLYEDPYIRHNSTVTFKWKKQVCREQDEDNMKDGQDGWKVVQNKKKYRQNNITIDYRLNPHQHAVHIKMNKWKECLDAIFQNRNDDNLKKMFKEMDNGKKPQQSETNNCVKWEDASGCFLTLALAVGDVVSLQLSSYIKNGLCLPFPQLLHLATNYDLCLEHTGDPVKHLTKHAEHPAKERYRNCEEYKKTWLSLLEMEAATNAASENRIKLVKNIKIRILNDVFEKLYCMIEDNDGNDKYLGRYLCIRYTIPDTKDDVNILPIMPTSEDQVWIGHFNRVRKQNSVKGFTKYELNSSTQQIPIQLLDTGDVCSVEFIPKTISDRIMIYTIQAIDRDQSIDKDTLAVAVALNNEDVALPKISKEQQEIASKQEYKKNISGLQDNNLSQEKAIKTAMNSTFTLIQGPPGSGKTITALNLICFYNDLNKRLSEEKKQVLYCGPSNKSVDVMAERFLKLPPNLCPKIIRVFSQAKEDEDFPVPDPEQPFVEDNSRCQKINKSLQKIALHYKIRQNYNEDANRIQSYDQKFKKLIDGTLTLENKSQKDLLKKDIKDYRRIVSLVMRAEIKEYEIILCTCITSARNLECNVEQCIIDEAAMCLEPEILVSLVNSTAEQLVLVGDHQQLRPIIRNKIAAEMGLNKSLFERYSTEVILLDTQYRMHQGICEFPSNEFYDGKLKTAKRKSQYLPENLRHMWPNQNYPIMFCHIKGNVESIVVNSEEGNMNSKSNAKEIKQVLRIAKKIRDQNQDVSIKVMSPYKSQCNKIKRLLDDESIDVNTVVSSQGGEWDIVILSLVCSLPNYLIEPNPTKGWCQLNIGCMTDPHQINVSLTRAKKGLIIIGNKDLYNCEEVWHRLLTFYQQKGCVCDAKSFAADF